MNYTEEQQDYSNQPQIALPNATAVLVLGIVAIVACCCYGGGAILSIIALVLASKDMKSYRANPHMFTQSSYKNLSAGRICAIIGLVFSISYLIMLAIAIGTFGWEALNNPDALQEMLEQYQ